MRPDQAPLCARVATANARVAATLAALCLLGCAAAVAVRDALHVRTISVVSQAAEGEGSLRAAILAANEAEEPVRIVSRLPAGTEIVLVRELPWLSGRDVELDAAGLVLRDRDCVRADGRRGCSGLVITGDRIEVRRLAATGFRFDGVSVRGAEAVAIRDSHFFGNLDDGIGISEGARGVLVENCLLERNGYRSKGKGVLIFDGSQAVLRGNEVLRNRDGVTVSKRAHALLEDNRIVDSYDKGLGVAGATLEGRRNSISGSGAGRFPEGAGPNADGLRVTIDSLVRLEASEVRGSGDRGVVAEGTSRVELISCVIEDNAGGDVRVAGDAVVEIDGRALRSILRRPAPR